MNRNSVFLCATLLALLVSVSYESGQAESTAGSDKFDDPVKYAHAILRGSVRDVTKKTVTLREYGIEVENDGSLDIAVITLDVEEVMKGMVEEASIEIALNRGALGRIERGMKVILCAFYWKYKGGTYVLRYPRDSFILEDSLWTRQSDNERVSIDQIRMTIEETTLPRVVDASELIVRGRVKAMDTSWEIDEAQQATTTATWTVVVEEVLKGSVGSEEVSFSMILYGASPEWRSRMPLDLDKEETAIGEEIIVFLKVGASGLYPFAGTNGVFQVKGEKLVYDSSLALPTSPIAFKAQIMGEVISE